MEGLAVAAPDCLKQPLIVPFIHLFGPGPVNPTGRVLNALSSYMMSPVNPQCYEIMDDVKKGLQYVFQTQNTMTLAISGSGTAGTEAILCNLCERGETVVVAVNGCWSLRALDFCKRLGTNAIALEKPFGEGFTLQEIEAALKKHKPVAFFIVHGESTTGYLQDMEGIGPLCHQYNCLAIVDAVITVGCTPVYVDKWELDAVVTASQKGLGMVPGLAPITLSPRAVKKIESRRTPVPVFFFDIKENALFWQCYGPDVPRKYHHTMCTNLILGLREALAEIAEEGLENRWKRHREVGKFVRDEVTKMGLELFVKDEKHLLDFLTSVRVTPDIDWQYFQKYAMTKYNIDFPPGQGQLLRLVHRFGTINTCATIERAKFGLKVFKEALEQSRVKK